MPERDEPWDVVIGRIVEAHGVRGWVKVLPLGGSAHRLSVLRELCLALPDGKLRKERVEEARAFGRYVLVKLSGLQDRDAAKALVGATINIKASMREPLPPGEYYIDQILGLRVQTDEGLDLGTVVEVIETGANDVYVTNVAMIPAVKEAISEINLSRGIMRVRQAAVLLDGQQ